MLTFDKDGSAYGHVALVTAVTATTVSIVKCDAQGGTVVYCPAGCNVGALGTHDTCK